MAGRDASKVQLDFPQLTADLIEALRLTGTLGLLELSDKVVPVVNVANIRPVAVTVAAVNFDSAEIISGVFIGVGANAVVLDTGAKAAGIYDMWFGCSAVVNAVTTELTFQWRNAANTANLATWPAVITSAQGRMANSFPIGPFALNIGLNERIRLVRIGTDASNVAGYVMMKLRPTP